MSYIIDFHLHSKYSRATSSKMDLEGMVEEAKIKGIDVLGSADFTHPLWFLELKNKLKEKNQGIYSLEKEDQVKFILSTEVSCIFSQNKKVRRIHLIILAPNLEIVEKINKKLSTPPWNAKLSSDGRPILGISAHDLVLILKDIDQKIEIIPAHIWTPWYSLFGSMSGFDSIEECFKDTTKYIFALETGLSSDILMNARLSALDKMTLVSNSDAHSLDNLAREANIVDLEELSYDEFIKTLKTKKGFLGTIEFYPQEGKYYFDGHRDCNISFSPEDSKKYKNLCPKCETPLTLGVYHRVNDLADREENSIPKNIQNFYYLIPLKEIIAEYFKVNKKSKKVERQYLEIIKKGKNELNVLLNLDLENLLKIMPEKMAQGIIKMRQGKVEKTPGYDGVYGKISLFGQESEIKQNKLF